MQGSLTQTRQTRLTPVESECLKKDAMIYEPQDGRDSRNVIVVTSVVQQGKARAEN